MLLSLQLLHCNRSPNTVIWLLFSKRRLLLSHCLSPGWDRWFLCWKYHHKVVLDVPHPLFIPKYCWLFSQRQMSPRLYYVNKVTFYTEWPLKTVMVVGTKSRYIGDWKPLVKYLWPCYIGCGHKKLILQRFLLRSPYFQVWMPSVKCLWKYYINKVNFDT